MIVQISKWGNSLAVRIPAVTSRDAGISAGMSANISVENGHVILKPIARRIRIPIDELVAQIPEEFEHEEYFGPEIGSERW